MRYSSLVLLAVLGCGGVKFKETEALTKRLGSYNVVRLDTTISDPSAFGFIREFEAAMVGAMTNRVLFKSYVLAGGEGGDVKLSIKISGVTKSHDVGTSMGGAFRGSGKVTADCILEDLKTGERLGAFMVSGKSGAFGSGGTGTQEALQTTVNQIADYLAAHR